MTAPRIDEMMKEFWNKFSMYDLGYKSEGDEVEEWITKALTQARQAGIDEAVEKALKPFKGTKNSGEWEDFVWWEGRRHALALVEKWVASNATTRDTPISDFSDQWMYEVDANELIDYLNDIKTQPSDDTIKALQDNK